MPYIIYKMKNSNNIKTITFPGSFISKRDVVSVVKVNEGIQYDELRVVEFEGDEYVNEKDLIPKFTTVEISRMPMINCKRLPKTNKMEFPNNFTKKNIPKPIETRFVAGDTTLTEDETVHRMVESVASKLPMRSMRPNKPPAAYTCHKCNIPGHYIEQCPGVKDQFGNYVDRKQWKAPSGIPRTRLEDADPTLEGVFMDNTGRYVRFAKGAVHLQKIPQKVAFSAAENPKYTEVVALVPTEFSCPLCNNVMLDVNQTPCCQRNYCSQCILNKLFDPENGTDGVCPSCSKPIPMLDMLIENEHLNKKISSWKISLRSVAKEVKEISPDSSLESEVHIDTGDPNRAVDPYIPCKPFNKPGYQKDLKSVVIPKPFEEKELKEFTADDLRNNLRLSMTATPQRSKRTCDKVVSNDEYEVEEDERMKGTYVPSKSDDKKMMKKDRTKALKESEVNMLQDSVIANESISGKTKDQSVVYKRQEGTDMCIKTRKLKEPVEVKKCESSKKTRPTDDNQDKRAQLVKYPKQNERGVESRNEEGRREAYKTKDRHEDWNTKQGGDKHERGQNYGGQRIDNRERKRRERGYDNYGEENTKRRDTRERNIPYDDRYDGRQTNYERVHHNDYDERYRQPRAEKRDDRTYDNRNYHTNDRSQNPADLRYVINNDRVRRDEDGRREHGGRNLPCDRDKNTYPRRR